MYVILTILKILGIILLVLLGLLLVIVFSVLFVPVRYRLEGEKSSPGWSEANGTGKKNSCEEKKAEKTVTDRRKDTNGCERAKIDRKADETREIKDG